MDDIVTILGFAGSLRKDSFNRKLLQTSKALLPDDAELEVFDLEPIPIFNQDLEHTPPQSVRDLKAKIKAKDAILIVTPEYNYSIPGVLKNAIDWASRPYAENAWNGKTVAVMGASTGRFGTARAQYHLRQCFVFLNMYPVNRPEVMVPNAQQSFDESGDLKDEKTRQLVSELLRNLVDWTRKLKTK